MVKSPSRRWVEVNNNGRLSGVNNTMFETKTDKSLK